MADYMKEWTAAAGPNNFSKDPPNATLSVYEAGKDENTLTVVEISHPVVEGKDLVYRYKLIEGKVPTDRRRDRRCSSTGSARAAASVPASMASASAAAASACADRAAARLSAATTLPGMKRPGSMTGSTTVVPGRMRSPRNCMDTTATRCPVATAWVALFTAALVLAAPGALAQANDAKAMLKAMSDYVGRQQTIELTFDSDIEVITPQLEKIQFTNSGERAAEPAEQAARPSGGWLCGCGDVLRWQDRQHLRQAPQRLCAVRRTGQRGSVVRGAAGGPRHRLAVRGPAADELV